MANQNWVLINIKQYCFDNSNKKNVEFFEQMLLGLLDSMSKIKNNYYDWYLCKKAYEHSKFIRKGERWPEAEKHIKKCPEIAYLYAKFVIKDRWLEAERYIKKCPSSARKYAKYVLKARWKSAEKTILSSLETDPRHLGYHSFGTRKEGFDYVINVVKKPNKQLENSILSYFADAKVEVNSEYMKKVILRDAIRYLKKVKKSRWEELELEITCSPHIKDYWEIIKKDKKASEIFYNKVVMSAMMPREQKESNVYRDTVDPNFNYAQAWLKSNPRNAKDNAA